MQNRVNHQKNLNTSLPQPQIGSKLTSLVNRFAQKYQQDKIVYFNDIKQKEKQTQQQNINYKNQRHSQYFKVQNGKIKEELKIVKEDLRLKNQDVKRCNNLISKLESTIKMFNITINARQKKIQNLMGFAKNLAKIFKTTTQYLPENIDFKLHSAEIERELKQLKEMASKSEQQFNQIFTKSQLLQSLNIFQKDILSLDIFKNLMTGITNTFASDNFIDSNDKFNSWKVISQLFTQTALENTENQMSNLLSKGNFDEKHSSNLTISQQVSETVLANCSSQKLYHQLRLIFDQQVYLFQSQKMKFRQFKNKKLIRGQKYECQTCEYYQKIFSDMLLIIKESFRDIKHKLLPHISSYEEIQILI